MSGKFNDHLCHSSVCQHSLFLAPRAACKIGKSSFVPLAASFICWISLCPFCRSMAAKIVLYAETLLYQIILRAARKYLSKAAAILGEMVVRNLLALFPFTIVFSSCLYQHFTKRAT